MKIRVCDVCEKPIKTWESVTYKERFLGIRCETGGVFPSRDTRKIKVDMCPECHKQFIDFLEACASVRKYKEDA